MSARGTFSLPAPFLSPHPNRTTSLPAIMFPSRVRCIATLVGIFLTLQLGSVWAVPTAFEGLDKKARDVLADLTPMGRALDQHDLEARATPAAPHFVVYADQYQSGVTGPPAVSAITVSFATA